MPKINRALNLVVEADSDEHGHLYLHSTPIAREIGDRFFRVIGSAYSQLWADELGFRAGPRYAYLMLKDVAEEKGQWAQIQKEIVNEVVRLTNVILPGKDGYSTMQLATAYARNVFEEEDRAEIEGNLIFFTLALHAIGPKRTQVMIQAIGPMWGSRTTASGLTEFLSSLPPLTPAASSAETIGSAPIPEILPGQAMIVEPGSTVAKPLSVPH